MALTVDDLGQALRTMEVEELTMLPRFSDDDAAQWPAVLSWRASGATCVVTGDHPAERSTTLGHPHSGLPLRWLDLCEQHAADLEERYGVKVAASAASGARSATDEGADGATTEAARSHLLATTLQAAARGTFPPYDGRTEVGGALPGPCDAVAFFPGHTVVAADVEPAWVEEALAGHADHPEDPTTGLGVFVAALTERLGNPATYAAIVGVQPSRAAMLRGRIVHSGDPDPGWSAYRTDVLSYHYRSGNTEGYLDLGRGPGARLDVYARLERAHSEGGGPRRELLAAAMSLATGDEQVFASAPLHDVFALRTLIEGGFTPVCTEIQFLTRPRM
jgi:hypothetical protein